MSNLGNGSGSLTDQAYATIKASIVNCELAPGQRITERLLAEQLGFGLSPIRSALVRLDNEGLVTVRPRSGYRVAPLTMDDVDSLFDAWSVLGAAIIARAAQRCTPRDLEEMTELGQALRDEQRRGHTKALDAAAEMAQMMWRTFCRLAGNPRLTDMFLRLEADLQRVFVIGAWDDPTGAEHFTATLGEGALRLGDPSSSVEEFRGYISQVRRHVVDTLQRSPSVRSHEIVLDDPGKRSRPN
jgi:DNA-binding GntR family transcriptional regulator